jgi:hypothetical protein
MILAPMVRRKPDSADDSRADSSSIMGFRAAYVFHVSQTQGQDLPQIGSVHGNPGEQIERLRGFAAAQNIAVEYSEPIAPARGTSYGGRIALLPGQSPAEEFSTLRNRRRRKIRSNRQTGYRQHPDERFLRSESARENVRVRRRTAGESHSHDVC